MAASQRPTSIRYVILALTVCVAVLLYLDRYCLGFVLPYIREKEGLDEDQANFLVSAFFYTYAFGQIPCGWLSDRFGTRLMLSIFLASWSTLTGLMGLAEGFAMLIAFRFGCGLFEAGAYPACAGLIRLWVPYEKRGFASGIISIGGRLGGTIAPLATAYLMVFFMQYRKLEGDSWQPVLMIYGTIGVLVAILFWSFYRDTPRQHFLANEAEAQLVERRATGLNPVAHSPMSEVIWSMLSSPGLWASAIVQFGTNFVYIFLGNQLPTYLQRVHQVPIETRGWMTFWPFCVSLPMLLVGGWWTDRMTKAYGPRIGRAFPLASTRFLGAVAMLACFFLDAPWPITIALCVFAMASDAGLAAVWAYNLDVGGRNVGLILGWGNMIGNLGAAVSAYALGFILKQFVDFDASPTIEQMKAGYGAVFLTCAGVFFFIGLVSLFVDATKKIGEEPRTK
jgi:sugar phosphate permease